MKQHDVANAARQIGLSRAVKTQRMAAYQNEVVLRGSLFGSPRAILAETLKNKSL
jgi:hypothetical protein